MGSFPLGVILDSFRLPTHKALDMAAALNVQGVQMYGTVGEVSPQMKSDERKELASRVKDHGLVISALCGDLHRGGFHNPERNRELIEITKRIIDLARDLGTNVVTSHIGCVPADKSNPDYAILSDAYGELADYAGSVQAYYAIETGSEDAMTLHSFLDELHSPGAAVNLDPANLVMADLGDPAEAVYELKQYIVHTHAKDGRYIKPGASTSHTVMSRTHIELPLGSGDVNFPAFLEALRKTGYNGFLTVERETGEKPAEDISKAITFLRRLLYGDSIKA